MLSLVKFNYLRLLHSKFFISVNIITLVSVVSLYFVWVNVDIEMFMHWISIAFLCVYLVVVNVSGLAMIMVNDLHNGVFSLEIRKGLPHQTIMWMKLLVLKSIVWFVLAVVMLLFFVIAITSTSNKLEQIISNHIPGLAAMFALDFLFTGIGLLIGSFLNTKLLSALLAFFAVPMVLSQNLATFHIAETEENSFTNNVNWYNFLKIQQLGKNNPKGLVAYLYKELEFFNKDTYLNSSEKIVGPETDSKDYLSYNDVQEFIKEDSPALLRYFLTIGQPFMLANYLNITPHLNKTATFELNQEYKDGLIYKFFKEIFFEGGSDPKKRDTKLDYGSAKKAKQSDLELGAEKLTQYFAYLQDYNFQQKILDKYHFTNYNEELDSLLKILKTIILSGSYIVKNNVQNSLDSVVSFFDDEALDLTNISDFNDLMPLKVNDWEKQVSLNDLWLSGGNQIFVRLLVHVIGYTTSFSPNTGSHFIKNSVNDLIQNNVAKRREFYATNPFMSFPYMTLFTGYAKNPIVNVNASKLIAPGGLPIQDLKISANLEPDTSKENFKAIDKLKIKDFEVSDLVFDAWIFYLWYFGIGITLGLAAHFIYIRKVKP